MSSKADDCKASSSDVFESLSALPVTGESPDSKSKKTETKQDHEDDDVVNVDKIVNKDEKNIDSSGEEKVAPKEEVIPKEEVSPKMKKRVTRKSIRKQEVEEQREKFLSMDLESKRKLYRSKYTTLEELQPWPLYYLYFLKVNPKAAKQLAVSDTDEKFEVRDDLNKKISIFHGDITSLEIDAVANAANESLLGGGGVDGAIHRAAGPDLLAECETLDGCEPGDAKITCGYKLPAKYVIHTVGPRGENPKVLKSCYVRCLELLKKHKLKTIAFPCISTGIFGYPNTRAAKVVVKTLRQWLETDEYAENVERIILCLFQKVDEDIYKKLLPIYFPIGSDVGSKVKKNSNAEKSVHEESSTATETKIDNKKEKEITKD